MGNDMEATCLYDDAFDFFWAPIGTIFQTSLSKSDVDRLQESIDAVAVPSKVISYFNLHSRYVTTIYVSRKNRLH